MIRFHVVKEPIGWAVIMGEATKAPFRSRRLAIQEARSLAEAIGRHGQASAVTIEPSPEPQTYEG